ncbi:MAG: UDP-N-acetylmuramoyl-L-alanine--D-glutamate ligase [Bacillota bacterium]|nr:UDP-N-acetylmuramoyl-L-alanine--D-glutamate ligase [Bacillota bacterium]
MKNQNILVYGTGISGVAAVRGLNKLNKNIYLYDDNKVIDEINKIDGLKDTEFYFLNKIEDINFDKIDIVIKSPSVPLDSQMINKAVEKNIPVLSDLEMAYRLTDKDLIVITGTNGKTTTTALTYKIIVDNGIDAGLTGNIGSGIMEDILEEKEIFVVEGSSYQLASTFKLKPKVAVITNISPDHLNWHGSFENYIQAKLNISSNQDNTDYSVLNFEDKVIRDNIDKFNSKIIFFSSKNQLEEGIFIKDKKIVYKSKESTKDIIELKDINIPGEHNIENIMAAAGVAIALELSIDKVRNSIMDFKGVEHRLELVKSSINNVKFYNDSKGTNPDSTIKAVKALKENIVIILGGYDKDSSFDELIKVFNNKVKYAVVLGETRNKIANTLEKYNYTNYKIVDNLEDAIKEAITKSQKGYKILLSPACASWDMYTSFEERGTHFKNIIKDLEKED